jgi:hypothetical protein
MVTESTLKKCGVNKNLLSRFEKHIKHSLLISDVNLDFKLKFERYCKSEKYAPNTIARAVRFFKTICCHARLKGIETSRDLDAISIKYVKSEHIYLTFDELDKIKNLDKDILSERLDNARDWLLICCYTAQRVSDFKKFNNTDFENYVFYNAVDSCLLHYIDIRLNTLSTFFKIAQVTGVEINRALSPVWTTEVLMLRKFWTRKRVIVDERKDEEYKKFEGAYVKPPLKGLHEWVTCYDFASLYPNTMMQFGLSPEIYIGKNLANPPEGAIKTASGAYFLPEPDQEPVLRDVLNNLYGMRKATKAKYKECEIKIE